MMQSQTQSSRPQGDMFLSRYAECMFWMARYLERVESVATLLEVTHTFSPASENEQNWQSVLALHDDEAAFAERYIKLTARNVIRFYLIDDSHSNSIFTSMHLARLNASQLRPVLSNEMWVQINKLYNFMRALSEKPVSLEDLSTLLRGVRKRVQTLSGIAEGGLYRDQGWYFYLLGKQLERADQTTRLLDIKYHLLLPSIEAVGSKIDAAQWFSLLRAASGYHAFRREYPYVITPSTVAGFLLLDRRFPRSVAACLDTVAFSLEKLYSRYGLQTIYETIALNQRIVSELHRQPIDAIITNGLHEYLDNLQLHFIQLSDSVSLRFF